MPASIAYASFNPFRQPDWRHTRVMQMVDNKPAPLRSSRRDDQWVVGFKNFLMRYRSYNEPDREQLACELPDIHLAKMIYDRKDSQRESRKAELIEARILAGQSNDAIAHELCGRPQIIEWYEKIFFNVRERLHAHDWIVDQVLMPAYLKTHPLDPAPKQGKKRVEPQPGWFDVSEPFFDCTVKFFAYFGGPFLLDHVITGFRRGAVATSRDAVTDWYDDHMPNRLRQLTTQLATTCRFNKIDALKLFEIHTNLIAIRTSAPGKAQTKDQMLQAMSVFLGGFKWAVGDEGREMAADTPVAAFDDSAVELRGDEMMLLSAGEKVNLDPELKNLKMPELKPAKDK